MIEITINHDDSEAMKLGIKVPVRYTAGDLVMEFESMEQFSNIHNIPISQMDIYLSHIIKGLPCQTCHSTNTKQEGIITICNDCINKEREPPGSDIDD